MAYSKDVLQNALDRIKQESTRTIPLYQNFTPKTLSYQPPVANGLYEQQQNATMGQYEANVATTEQEAANYRLEQQKEAAQKALEQAQKNYVKKQPQKVVSIPTYNPTQDNATGYDPGTPGKYGLHPTQNLSYEQGLKQAQTAKGNVNPYASLVTMHFHGMSYTVNSTVAQRFQGFLQALWKAGYHPTSIGGYSNRNIAGTSTKSLHAYGLAIDIDPSKNPVTWDYGKNDHYALPPNVGALAAKYGLTWGGSWHNAKRDYMHFSVPMFGEE